MITRNATNPTGKSNVTIHEGLDICCDDPAMLTYESAAIVLATHATIDKVVVQIPGEAEQTVDIGTAINWTTNANDNAIKTALEKVATDLGYLVFENSFVFDRATAGELTLTIKESTLIFKSCGPTTGAEIAFTAL